MEIVDLKLQIEEAQKEYNSFIDLYDYENSSFQTYQNQLKPHERKLSELNRKLKLLLPYTTKKYSEDMIGTLIDFDSFVQDCKDGFIVDYDGYGYYVHDDNVSDLIISPSDVTHDLYRKDFNKVLWLSR